MTDDQRTIDDFIRLKSGEGWQVIARSESSVQLRKPKQVNRGWIVLGLLTLPLWGIGLVVWGLVLIDYLTQDEKIAFYTVDDIRSGVEVEESGPVSMIRIIIIILVSMVILFALIILFASLWG